MSFWFRLLSLALNFAFKMLSEHDCFPVNEQLAEANNLSLQQFNALEMELLSKYEYNVGIGEEEFQNSLQMLTKSTQEFFGLSYDLSENSTMCESEQKVDDDDEGDVVIG